MAWLYVRYVRSIYYEQDHPVRYNAISGTVMMAILWPLLLGMGQVIHQSGANALMQAATYSYVFSAMRVWQVHRARGQYRFERWAAKHPSPEELEDPATLEAVTACAPLPRGMSLVPWVGWTLLAAFLVALTIGMPLSALQQSQGPPSTAQNIVVPTLALLGGVLLRMYWPPIRNWGRAPQR